MGEFEPRSKLGIGNGGVPDKFDVWRRKRDRARRAVQTAERREADLQQRRRRLAGETDEVRQARLQ